MSKSLAERIGAETRKVMKEREKANKEANMAFVLKTLRRRFKVLGEFGEKLFEKPDKRELFINPEIFNKIEWEVAKEVLKEIGFEIHEYPMRDYLAIPEKNVTKEIQELVEMYNKIYMSFVDSEIQQAETDCKEILEKLQKDEYEVEDVDKISVNFMPTTASPQYDTRVKEIMKENHFEVTITGNKWQLHILKKSD